MLKYTFGLLNLITIMRESTIKRGDCTNQHFTRIYCIIIYFLVVERYLVNIPTEEMIIGIAMMDKSARQKIVPIKAFLISGKSLHR